MQTVSNIGVITLTADAASATFSSIPTGFSDLTLVADCFVPSTGYNLVLRFNGDGGGNYSYKYLLGNGTSVSAGQNSNISSAYVGAALTTRSISVIDIFAYADTNKIKTIISNAGNGTWGISTWVSLWNSKSTITSITILPEAGNLSAGSKFTLYGVI